MNSRFSIAVAPAIALLIFALTATFGRPLSAESGDVAQPDKYAWLEDIYGEKQLAWVKAENARTADVLEKDARFAPLEADALHVLESPDRLPVPVIRGNSVYNTWRDAEHVRGILRRTTIEGYLSSEPQWETVLDYDALAKQDKQSWVAEGLICLAPEEERCLVGLSAGGEDADTLREFDLKTGTFVANGFVLPRGKQSAAWLDKDTLLVAREWGPGSMSEAGYPITIHEWKRGEPLESAKEVFHGDVKDNGYGDEPFVYVDGQGHRVAGVTRSLSTFVHEHYLLSPSGPQKLDLPSKTELDGFADNQLLFTLVEDWTPSGQSNPFKQGSVIGINVDQAKKDATHLKPTLLFAPTAEEFKQQLATTHDRVIVATLDHVQGRIYAYTYDRKGHWTRKPLPVPDNLSVFVASTNWSDDRFFVNETGFLTPSSAWLGDADAGTLKPAKAQKPLFDGSNDVVEQLETTSKDGTKVPYFVVHRKDMPYDGNNPTLLSAYGGFEISVTPTYSGVMGKLWLEHGGVFVLANIRGGGEFGPAWHEAGLKTHRQRIYDDFYAVAQDLVARKITSTPKLGIQGGSNGGLLMGVEFTQHPEMWGAVVIQVPLLDMLGFEHLSAGASWVGEYGSASVPEERAFLASISPYNQLKPGVSYPTPLIFTTTKDDRVGPVHARKFAARMEEFHEPFFYDEVVEGGHGLGADLKETARSYAEVYTYLSMKLMQ